MATLNVIFSITADCIAAKFCMTIKKIKPNDTYFKTVLSIMYPGLLFYFNLCQPIQAVT